MATEIRATEMRRVPVLAEDFFGAVGRKALSVFALYEEWFVFLLRLSSGLVFAMRKPQTRLRQVTDQVFRMGVESLPVVGISLGFVSLLLTLEFSFHMRLVLRQDSLVPAFSSLLLIRELGPVVVCLLMVSRVGAGMAAELALMKVTDQIDALTVLSIDPIQFLVVPRFFACIVSCVCLSFLCLGIALVGGAFIAELRLGISSEQFFQTMFTFVRSGDFVECFVKSGVFGAILPIIAAYHGLRCQGGSAAVGEAATNAVVQGSVMVIVADFVVTKLVR